MRLIIEPTYSLQSEWAAKYVATKIRKANPTPEKPFVLGLPTGSTPLEMYMNLIELNRKGVISFQNVVTFNMDEYVGLPEDHPQSYHSFMWDNFFSHIDIRKENVNILNGNAHDLEAECENYEKRIAAAGGIDLFLGGVGPDGHIAFNEPPEPDEPITDEQFAMLSTRTLRLTRETRTINAVTAASGYIDYIPRRCITVGMREILSARQLRFYMNRTWQKGVVRKIALGPVTRFAPASFLQTHPDALLTIASYVAEPPVGQLR